MIKNKNKTITFISKCCGFKYDSQSCCCSSIKIINRSIHNYINTLKNLPTINYNKSELNYKSINSFIVSSKNKNDSNNKLRESIIGAIINNKIPSIYFNNSKRWYKMKISIDEYIANLCKLNNINKINSLYAEHKGGRKFNYDFSININNVILNVELKFNAETISDTPQFSSPMKPSQYMSKSYEEYYYNNYMSKLANSVTPPLNIPSQEEYMNNIHTNKPECIQEYQTLYYQGCKGSSKFTGDDKAINFYKLANILDNESRKSFIENNELNIHKLSEYLQNTQKDKIYMLYKNGKFNLVNVNINDYILTSYEKNSSKYRFDVLTKSEKKMKVLLRWKNGNGIAYPAFQIS